jgi:hypothetical protein
MARQTVNIGSAPNDGTGDPLRVAYDKLNDNFLEIYDDGGANIIVNNPVTSTETTLDVALADIEAGSGGGAVTSVNSDTGAVIVDLQSATDEGNETTNPIKVAELFLYDSANSFYNKITTSDGIFNFILDDGTVVASFDSGGGFTFVNASGFKSTDVNSSLTANRTHQKINESGDSVLTVIKTSSFTAVNSAVYTANGTLTVTDPTPLANKGFIVHVIGGTSTIGGVGYTTGDLVYRYYDGSSWISKNYNQDLQSVLTNGGTVIEGDNEFYIDVINGKLEFGTVGAVSSSFFKVNSDEDIIINNANNVSQKNASIQIDTDGNLSLNQKSVSNSFGTEITITEPTANRSITFKDESGTVALTSDIPSPITIDATPTDGSSNAVSSNGVFDALATKVSKSDYTPAHSILVQQSGTGTPTALSVGNNTLVGRLSGGGSDINDLSVSDVRTLLDIDTDLALKQDKNRSETFVLSKANGTFGSHTGTTAETVLFSADISANEFTAGDFMRVMLDITKVGTAGTASVRLRAGTTGTTSDALIGTLFLIASTLDAGFIRERFQFLSGNLLSGIQNTFTSNQTDTALNSVIKQSTSLTPSNAWKITVSVALANSADTVSCLGYRVSKIKSI